MKVPTEQLLAFLTKPFSRDLLSEMEKAASVLPPLSPNQRVATYVLRRVCTEAIGFMDAIQPIETARHDAIEKVLRPALENVVRGLAQGSEASWAELASLIRASEEARITT